MGLSNAVKINLYFIVIVLIQRQHSSKHDSAAKVDLKLNPNTKYHISLGFHQQQKEILRFFVAKP